MSMGFDYQDCQDAFQMGRITVESAAEWWVYKPVCCEERHQNDMYVWICSRMVNIETCVLCKNTPELHEHCLVVIIRDIHGFFVVDIFDKKVMKDLLVFF